MPRRPSPNHQTSLDLFGNVNDCVLGFIQRRQREGQHDVPSAGDPCYGLAVSFLHFRDTGPMGISREEATPARDEPLPIAAMLARLSDVQRTVMFYEGARFHEQRFKEYGLRLADLADLVREGLQIPTEQYDDALAYISECKTRVAELYKDTPVILVPAATGPAPLSLASTGDSRMNAPWTALGTPAISIPMPVENGLPLGLQLTAEHGQDARVIRTAVRLQQMLGSPSAV